MSRLEVSKRGMLSSVKRLRMRLQMCVSGSNKRASSMEGFGDHIVLVRADCIRETKCWEWHKYKDISRPVQIGWVGSQNGDWVNLVTDMKTDP